MRHTMSPKIAEFMNLVEDSWKKPTVGINTMETSSTASSTEITP